MVDAEVSKTSDLTVVRVRVSPRAPDFKGAVHRTAPLALPGRLQGETPEKRRIYGKCRAGDSPFLKLNSALGRKDKAISSALAPARQQPRSECGRVVAGKCIFLHHVETWLTVSSMETLTWGWIFMFRKSPSIWLIWQPRLMWITSVFATIQGGTALNCTRRLRRLAPSLPQFGLFLLHPRPKRRYSEGVFLGRRFGRGGGRVCGSGESPWVVKETLPVAGAARPA